MEGMVVEGEEMVVEEEEGGMVVEGEVGVEGDGEDGWDMGI